MTDKKDMSLNEFETSVDDLYRSFPIIFRNKPTISVMVGWHELIADCAFEMEKAITSSNDYASLDDCPMIIDIKEKYGSLRICVVNSSEDLFHITSKYENMSMQVCETCGRPGKLTRKGWIRSTCDIHE